ncbi:hypothetical protein GPECTOR_1g535 [Gonium pectorale]|uniref:Uncharacterized protein n=1 Tax=Gonium pectorale TaxID=33097 RepID=A0A150H3I8_GONPE|nr:hypothetical protein GPECTOR_1g535 [Gonium pectorale]|eukprot:KXZ56595.1 hypothetical protein GPECTOR_1g535 [Gonium pectorale]
MEKSEEHRWGSLNKDVLEAEPEAEAGGLLLELDAQPPAAEAAWASSLASIAACLPRLSEIMVYVSSRVPPDTLGAQLRSLPSHLPGLTKLELRYVVPSSAPCLGSSLQQLQPALTQLTGLAALYLIMGSSPEPSELSTVLPRLPALRDLKLLSGLPQYGLTDAKLAALGAAGGHLQRLQLELSGLGQATDAGLAALGRLGRLRALALDGLVALGPELRGALQRLTELRELTLELDSPQQLPDLFALQSLTHLNLSYVGDELDDDDDDGGDDNPAGAGGPGAGGAGGGCSDWEALEALVRCNARRPVLRELRLLRCCFPADPLPRLGLLTSLAALAIHDCRWRGVWAPQAPPAASAAAGGIGSVAAGGAAAVPAPPSPAAVPTQQGQSWRALASLTQLRAFGLAQCVTPPIGEPLLAELAAAWPGLTSLQLQSLQHPAALSPLPPHCHLDALLPRWRRLEALTLSGSWCNDPRVTLDVACLPASLTSLAVSSMTLVHTAEALRGGGGGGGAAARPPPPPVALPALEHLVLGEVRLGRGVTLGSLLAATPALRSLEISNLLPNLSDDGLAGLAALTALTALRVSQDQESSSDGGGATSASAPLTGMGLTALTGLRSLRQLEWLPWGCEPLGLEHVAALAPLRRLHLVTLRGARDGAITDAALEALREALPLCDIDDTEWSGLVDV